MDFCTICGLAFMAILFIVSLINSIVTNIRYRHSFRYALRSGNLEQHAKTLVERGCNINAKDAEGVTILYVAAQSGDWELVQWLIEHGADVNVIINPGCEYAYDGKTVHTSYRDGEHTVLQIAIQSGNLDIVKYLVEHGAEIQTALEPAAYDNQWEIVKYLVEHGGDIQEALNLAVQDDNLEMVQWLVKKGADIHYNEENALDTAAKQGYLKMVQWLVKQGADIHINGENALHSAANNDHWEVVKYLVKKGADINSKRKQIMHIAISSISKIIYYAVDAPSSILVETAHDNSVELIQWLVDHGADVNAKNSSGYTPLHFAATKNLWRLFPCLIDLGADINAKSNDGKTVLKLAVENKYINHNAVVPFLIELGSDVNEKTPDGFTPLQTAAFIGNMESIICLVEQGADVNAKNSYGRTALHYAVQNNDITRNFELRQLIGKAYISNSDFEKKEHLKIVKYLIEHGADINAKDNDGESVLQLAVKCGNKNLIPWLKEHGAKEE